MNELRPLLYDVHSGLGLPKDPARLFAECVGLLIRGHDGMWTDPLACMYVRLCEKHSKPWGIYHVLKTNASVNAQVALWLRDWPDGGTLRRWLDYEESKKLGTIPSGAQLATCVTSVEQRDGRLMGIYSRAKLIDVHLVGWSTVGLNRRYWWLAQYYRDQAANGEYPALNPYPRRLRPDRVVLHQTADKLAPPPGAYPPTVLALDRDRWQGIMTLTDFIQEASQ